MREIIKKYKVSLWFGIAICVITLSTGSLATGIFGWNTAKRQALTENIKPVATEQMTPQGTMEPEVTVEPIETCAPTEVPVQVAKLNFTGDLMVHDYQYQSCYDSATGTYDFSKNFIKVKKYLKNADYTVGNFETVLGGKEIGISSFPRFNSPDSFATSVKDAGFDLLTTANNHCVDRGVASLERTISVLDKKSFDHIGTYRSKKASKKIFVKEINGIKIAFLSCTYGTNGLSYGESYHVKLLNEAFYKSIKKARKKADYVIVLPHNGTEYQIQPSSIYQKQYRRMLEAGADAVIASHPHILQPMEYQKVKEKDGSSRTCFVAYSLGNFISSQRTQPRDAGVILSLKIKKKGEDVKLKSVEVIPTWVRMKNVQGQTDFTVYAVHDLLTYNEKKRAKEISARDYYRVQQVQEQSTKTLLGKSVSVNNSKKRYTFPMNKK